MVNYELGKVYKIVCNLTGKVYVGSTCEPTVAKRLSKHVADYKPYLIGKYRSVSSFEIIANNCYEIVLIENFPCVSKDELHARERYWSNQIECVNKCKNQGIMQKMGGEKEYDKVYNKQYFIKNKDKLQQQVQCKCGSIYSYYKKSYHFKTEKHKQVVYDLKLKEGIVKCKTFSEFCKFMNS